MKKYIILLITLFLCGCQSNQEINNLSIVNSMGIDIQDNKYVVSIQILNTSKKEENDQENMEQSLVYTTYGNNISEALNNFFVKTSKKLYLGHLSLVLVSENLAKDNINYITDYFLRNSDVSKNFTMLVSKDNKIEDTLKKLESNTTYPTGNILGSVEVSSNVQGDSVNIKFTKFMSDLNTHGKNPVLSAISINEDNLSINHIAVFKNEKLVGYLNDDENIGYNFIIDNIKNANINYKCDGNSYIGINITNSKTTMSNKFENDKPIIYLDIDVDALITEVNCKDGINDLDKVRTEVKNEINKYIEKVISVTKEDFKSDIFGFGRLLYQNNYSYFKAIENNWDNKIYPSLEIETNINIKLNNEGSILKTVR